MNVRDCHASLPGISMKDLGLVNAVIKDNNHCYVPRGWREPAAKPASGQEAPASRRIDSEGEGPT
jgi:hypothetical protein